MDRGQGYKNMSDRRIKIVRVLPTGSWVVVEITGPDPKDARTKVVDILLLSKATIEEFKRSLGGVN